MKKLFFINLLTMFLCLFISCKLTHNKIEVSHKKEPFIDFCYIKDSIMKLPEYNYSNAKSKTKIYNVAAYALIDTAEMHDFQKQGYRVIIFCPRTTHPFKTDSIKNFVHKAQNKAVQIIKQRLNDSIFKNTGIQPTEAQLTSLLQKRLNTDCNNN